MRFLVLKAAGIRSRAHWKLQLPGGSTLLYMVARALANFCCGNAHIKQCALSMQLNSSATKLPVCTIPKDCLVECCALNSDRN